MSSFTRRMQRAAGARKTGLVYFGTKLGMINPKARDLLARKAREEKRAR